MPAAAGRRLRLIFDLDGTLVDSVPSLAAAANALLAELGRPPVEPAVVAGFVGHGMDALVDRVLAATGGEPSGGVQAARARFRTLYDADPVSGARLYPGVAAAVRALAGAGHGLAVCTQKPAAPARVLLSALGLMPPFTGLTAGDSLDALKPDPRLVAHAAAQLPPGPVIYVGDSEVDAETAARAGVPFILHLNGYRRAEVADIPCAATFGDFAALPGLIGDVAARGGAA